MLGRVKLLSISSEPVQQHFDPRSLPESSASDNSRGRSRHFSGSQFINLYKLKIKGVLMGVIATTSAKAPVPRKRGRMSRRSDKIGISADRSSRHGNGVHDVSAAKQTLNGANRALLCQSDLFRGMTADQCDGLVGRARMGTFMPDECIFLMGAEPHCMVVILSGHVEISVSAGDGNEVVLAILGPGQLFGEISLLHGGVRTADARAMTECSLAILYRRDVLSFFDEHPIACANIVSMLCERLRRLDQQITEVAMVALPVRLAKALLRMTPPEQDFGSRQACPPLRLTQRQFGQFIGATRESVNKHFGVWQRRGVIRITKGMIEIEDRACLEDLARTA
jgi:CRP/FNR family transcriptional regulator, cyclic AMP receptor protein